MNPLDKDELKAFLQIIKKDMPVHTDKLFKIKSTWNNGIPKNMIEFDNKVDNKFLNDNLHVIEEIEYRKKGITNDFKNYQNKYYHESGILNHDLYFEHDNKIYSKVKGSGILINPYNFVIPSPLPQSELISGTDGTSSGSGWNGDIISVQLTGATISKYFSQLAVRINVASGFHRMGIYTETSSKPNLLLDYFGSTSQSVGITYYNLQGGNVTITTVNNWVYCQTNNNSSQWGANFSSTMNYPSVNWGYANPSASYGISTSTTSIQPNIRARGV